MIFFLSELNKTPQDNISLYRTFSNEFCDSSSLLQVSYILAEQWKIALGFVFTSCTAQKR